ncbi:hypothetical protein [Nocardiopsis kunsanensis]|uniref:Uncharacterized protein n=1 Tax=Nocardiopsis kunsanensis TaxID=141693 RepID=A0A919CFM9_9ACTN|nr:hypothetical protein [Nocardiopsis kunsanensis]GHD18820.1 hypothetical protein GCM10007147_09390 [Nocardiopsis kunsanensis]
MSTEDPSSRPRRSAPVVLLVVTVLCVLLLASATHPGANQVPAEGADDGMTVLRSAAEAEGETHYAAVRRVTGPDGRPASLRVANHPDRGIVFAPVASEDEPFVVEASQALESLDDRLLEMLRDTYRVVDAGRTEIDGRPARLVEAVRADGTVAGRFWVDTGSGLLVGRTAYGRDGGAALSMNLTDLEMVEGEWPERASTGQPWGEALDAREREDLRSEGWELREHLTWDLRLVDARSTRYEGRKVVHAVYSDGLAQISLFLQRGKLGTDHSSIPSGGYVGTEQGGTGISPGHDTLFGDDVGQYRTMWQADGFVFTVLADAPADLATSAVTALPSPEGPGFWDRVERGLDRMGPL